MITKIICLKWGDKYGPEYVNKLFGAVKRNTTQPFEFWCFTDNTTGINPAVHTHRLPYAGDLHTWWNKVWLFSNELPFKFNERIFYIDLDTLIVDNIDSLLSAPIDDGKVIALEDFYWGVAKTATRLGSGLMSWMHGTQNEMWKMFKQNPEACIELCRPHGDQKWVELYTAEHNKSKYWQHLYPNEVVSYKVHCQTGLPPGAKIVCYHGRPSIPESATQEYKDSKRQILAQSWVLDYWRE